MLVTLSGMIMLVKPVQLKNAELLMLVTLFGMVTLVKSLQPRNADPPMLVTLLPMVTLVKLVQFLNASLPIEVIVVLGRIMDAICFKPASPGATVLLALPVEKSPLLDRVLPERSRATNLPPVLSAVRSCVQPLSAVPIVPKSIETFRGTGSAAVPSALCATMYSVRLKVVCPGLKEHTEQVPAVTAIPVNVVMLSPFTSVKEPYLCPAGSIT